MHKRLIPFLALATLVAGCAEWERNAYEGLRTREEMQNPPGQPERTAPPPDYNTYKKDKP